MPKFIPVGDTLVSLDHVVSVKPSTYANGEPCVEVCTTTTDKHGSPVRLYAPGTIADFKAANPEIFA